MSKEFSATRLDVRQFAQSAASLEQVQDLSAFARLSEEAQLRPGDTHSYEVHWHAEGELVAQTGGTGDVWLHLQADAVLPLICQRCLTVAPIALQIDRSFRFVADETTAEEEDDESEEDLLALSQEFDLHALIEDELLMDLPVVPMHDVCPEHVPLASSDEDFEQANTQKENPFAVLQALQVAKPVK